MRVSCLRWWLCLYCQSEDGYNAVHRLVLPSDCAGPVSRIVPVTRARCVKASTVLLHYHACNCRNGPCKRMVFQKIAFNVSMGNMKNVVFGRPLPDITTAKAMAILSRGKKEERKAMVGLVVVRQR